jgi:hypothetical protein
LLENAIKSLTRVVERKLRRRGTKGKRERHERLRK